MPSDVPFRTVKKLLEQHGWYLVRIKGSHFRFKGEGRGSVTIPVHRNKVKHVYYDQVLKEIDRLKAREQADEEAGEECG